MKLFPVSWQNGHVWAAVTARSLAITLLTFFPNREMFAPKFHGPVKRQFSTDYRGAGLREREKLLSCSLQLPYGFAINPTSRSALFFAACSLCSSYHLAFTFIQHPDFINYRSQLAKANSYSSSKGRGSHDRQTAQLLCKAIKRSPSPGWLHFGEGSRDFLLKESLRGQKPRPLPWVEMSAVATWANVAVQGRDTRGCGLTTPICLGEAGSRLLPSKLRVQPTFLTSRIPDLAC